MGLIRASRLLPSTMATLVTRAHHLTTHALLPSNSSTQSTKRGFPGRNTQVLSIHQQITGHPRDLDVLCNKLIQKRSERGMGRLSFPPHWKTLMLVNESLKCY